MSKEQGGLGHWNLKAKVAAFQNLWIAKLISNKLNPLLTSTFKAVTELYAQRTGTQVPIWESRLDHSQTIIQWVGSPLLAMLQASWARVVRRSPHLAPGTWVAYSNAEDKGKKLSDQVYDGRARIVTSPLADGTDAPADWYEWSEGSTRFTPLPEGEVWHLPADKCYILKGPVWPTSPNNIIETDPQSAISSIP